MWKNARGKCSTHKPLTTLQKNLGWKKTEIKADGSDRKKI